jgi:hypothetical protein
MSEGLGVRLPPVIRLLDAAHAYLYLSIELLEDGLDLHRLEQMHCPDAISSLEALGQVAPKSSNFNRSRRIHQPHHNLHHYQMRR